MNDISKEAVDALLQGVTAGPWWLDGPVWNQVVWSSADNRVCFMTHSNGLDDARDLATARFIAAARELVPALRAALDEAEAALKTVLDRESAAYARHDAALAKAEAREAALLAANEINRETLLRHNADCDRRIRKAEAERDAANALLRRAKTELELIRSKDCGAVYDILVRIEIAAHLGAKP